MDLQLENLGTFKSQKLLFLIGSKLSAHTLSDVILSFNSIAIYITTEYKHKFTLKQYANWISLAVQR